MILYYIILFYYPKSSISLSSESIISGGGSLALIVFGTTDICGCSTVTIVLLTGTSFGIVTKFVTLLLLLIRETAVSGGVTIGSEHFLYLFNDL